MVVVVLLLLLSISCFCSVTECLLGVASVVIGVYLLTSQHLISHPFVSKVGDETETGSRSSVEVSLSLGRFVYSAFHHVERTCLVFDATASSSSPWLPLRTGYLAGAVVMATAVLHTGENLFALGALLVMETDVLVELLSQLLDRNASNSTKTRLSVTGCLVSVLTRLLLPPIYCYLLVVVCDRNPSDMSRLSMFLFVFSAFFVIFAVFMIRSQLARIRRNSGDVSLPGTSSVELGKSSTEWRRIDRPHRFQPPAARRGFDEHEEILVLRSRRSTRPRDPLCRARSMPQLSGTCSPLSETCSPLSGACSPMHRRRSEELRYAKEMLKLLLANRKKRTTPNGWTNLREYKPTTRTGPLPTIHEIPE